MTTRIIMQYVLFGSIIFSCVSGLYRFKRLDTASRILSVLISLGLVTEILAAYSAKEFHNNLPIYIVYSLIEYSLFCLYFNTIIHAFSEKKIGLYFGVLGLLFWIIDITFIEHFNHVNSNFLFFEGLTIIGLSLFSILQWIRDEDFLDMHRYSHFWFICIFIFFWTLTYLSWGLNYYSNKNSQQIAVIINIVLEFVNITAYTGFGCVFILYPKMKKRYE